MDWMLVPPIIIVKWSYYTPGYRHFRLFLYCNVPPEDDHQALGSSHLIYLHTVNGWDVHGPNLSGHSAWMKQFDIVSHIKSVPPTPVSRQHHKPYIKGSEKLIRKTFLKNPSSPNRQFTHTSTYTSGITPTKPDQRREPEDVCIKKKKVRTGMCHILMEAPLSLDNALVLCHIHLIHTGQAGLRGGLIFLTLKHKATERRPPWLTQGEEKRLSNQNNTHSSSCCLDSCYWWGSSCSSIESAHSLWWSIVRV